MLSKRWVKWLVIFSVWTLLGFFFVIQNYIYNASTNREFDLVQATVYRLSSYWLWALLTPFIIYLVRKFKLEQPGRAMNILKLVLIGVPLAFFQSFTGIFISFLINGSLGKLQTSVMTQLSNAKFGIIGGSFDSFIMFCTIVTIVYIFDYYKKNREHQMHLTELENRLAQSELQSLKMQLQPHFLFNTLHAISALMHRDPDAADKMITRLSDLLRISLDNIGVQKVTLKDEMEFLEKYIDIQKIRFQDSLNVEIEIAPETLNVLVPNLILQPIVENAFKHGVERNSSDKIISISSVMNNGNLELKISDNGPGISGNGNKDKELSNGLGLNNTRARLQQLYGKNYKLDISEPNSGGLMVLLSIPHNIENITE